VRVECVDDDDDLTTPKALVAGKKASE